MATITYGAIIVPILQDFTPNDVHHIVNHSESVFLFTSDSIWESLEEEKLTGLRGVFRSPTSAASISGTEKPFRSFWYTSMMKCTLPIQKDSRARTFNTLRYPMIR